MIKNSRYNDQDIYPLLLVTTSAFLLRRSQQLALDFFLLRSREVKHRLETVIVWADFLIVLNELKVAGSIPDGVTGNFH
jgi:hypothetical protein